MLKGSRLNMVKAGLTVLAVCALWASSDEIHQSFTGRSVEFSDVILDSTTAAVTLAIMGFITARKKKNAASGRRFKTYYKDKRLNF